MDKNIKKNYNRYKYLFINTGILTISNFGSKILTFFLIPLYTSSLLPEEYGIYDLIVTTIALLIPILTLNIQDAVLRFTLDKKYNAYTVFKSGIKYTVSSVLILLILEIINYNYNLIPFINEYFTCFILLYIGESLYYLLIKFARGTENVKISALSGVLNTLSVIILNVVFLLVFDSGLIGYFAANIISYFVTIIYLIISLKIKKKKNTKKYNETYDKEMLHYSCPLIFDNISWWIINASDRYMLTYYLGYDITGIYSIAYKLPSVLNVFQSIFNQAWTISAVKEKNEDSLTFYSNIYKFYSFLMITICSMLILLDKIIAKILFSGEFYSAWKYAPLLMISVVFGSLSGLLGGIFVANKDSQKLSRTTIVGSFLNIILNFIFINLYGPMGAAISTLLSYFLIWIIRTLILRKSKQIKICVTIELINFMVLLLQTIIILNIKQKFMCYGLELILFLAIILINIKVIKELKNKVFKGMKGKRV